MAKSDITPVVAADPVMRLEEAVSAVAGGRVALERPADPSHGDYATNLALQRAGAEQRIPREIADEIAARVNESGLVESAEVAGPGFVNFRLSDEWIEAALADVLASGDTYGSNSAAAPQRIQVEMVSANPTGPLTVASGRNGAYGDSVARLLEFAGNEVSREYYYNDAGRQMDLFRASVEAAREGAEPPQDGYRGAYVAELAKLGGDPVPQMLERIEATLERFRIHFDSWARQSELEKRLPDLLPRLDTYEQDGALWARSSEYGDDQDWVLIRSAEQGGQPTYRAADVPYVEDKLGRGFDRAIYVLGADHHGTRKWFPAVARMLGYDPERVEILVYQLVHLTLGGQATKMAKRTGDVVFLDDFMNEIGVDAARWYLVSRGHEQTIEIDVDLASEKTQKNPVYYVQYAHARVAGILRNAGKSATETTSAVALTPAERDLVKRLLEFPALAAEAADRRAPHAIPTYAIRVADDFHRFYHDQRVLGSEAEAFRLHLCRATQLVITRCLDLIGVEAPDRM
jgi:arginyl-tRNA synthetase